MYKKLSGNQIMKVELDRYLLYKNKIPQKRKKSKKQTTYDRLPNKKQKIIDTICI